MTVRTSAAATPSVERRAAQVRKILESRSLQHADALKRLLDYLARHALTSHGAELKEYTVGIEAFGKPGDYNPQLDSSVRVQAGKLRQKLNEYYRTDGAADDLIVSLPQGHFRLEFQERPQSIAPLPLTVPAAAGTPPRVGWRWWAPPLTSAVVVILALGALLFLYPRTPRAAAASSAATVWTPEMEELWRPFLSSPRPLLVAIGTPLFVKIGGSFFRDPTLNTWENANSAAQVREVQRAVGGDTAGAFLYTGIGEAEGAFELGRLLLTRNRDITIRASSQLTWEDIDRYNVIFLGPSKYNQQTLDLPVRQDFEINHAQVQNLHPAPGEPAAFDEKFGPDHVHLEEGHALISRLPGLHRTGEIMVLAGTYTESTAPPPNTSHDPSTSPHWSTRCIGRATRPSGSNWWSTSATSRTHRSRSIQWRCTRFSNCGCCRVPAADATTGSRASRGCGRLVAESDPCCRATLGRRRVTATGPRRRFSPS